jgi:hypothetical protein
MKKNAAGQKIGAQMISASDGSAFTGAVTVYVTGDAGTQASGSVGSGACVHEGNGFHTYAPSQAETDYDHIAFTFIGSGAVPTTVQVYPTTIDTQVAAVKAKTDLIPATPAATGDAMTLTTGERNSVADAMLNRDMSAGTDSGSPTVRTPRQALRILRNKWSISGVTQTITKEDDSTPSWTQDLTTNASADPVTGTDPAGP